MSAFVPIIEAPDENRGLFGIIGSNTSLTAVFGSDTPETYTHYYAESGGVRSGSNFGFLVGVSNELFTIRSGLDSASNASNASSSAYMTSNGFFGLGTDDPKERLHVAGNMVLDGKIFDGFGSEIVLGGGGGGENGSWRKLADDSDYHPTISAPDTGVFQTTCNVILQHYFGNDMILNLNIDGTVITRPSPPGGDYTMNLPVFMDVTSYPIETTVGELWLTTSSNNGPHTIFKALAKSIPGSNESIAIRYLTGTTEVSLANINSGMEISLQGIVRYQTVLYNIITAEDSITIPGDTMKWMPIREPHPMFAAPLGGSSTTLLRQGLMRYLGDELIYRVLFEATLDSQPSSSEANARDYTISLEYPIAPQAYINSNAIIGDLWLTVINETTATNFKAYARTVDGDTSKVAIRFLNGTFDQSLAEIDAGSTIRIQGNIVYKAEQVASLAIPRAYLPNNLYQDNDGNVAINNYGRPMRARFEIIETSNQPALIVDQQSDADIAQFRSNVNDIKLIIDSRGHIGVGTTIAPYPFTVKGGMLFDGTMYDATGNAIWIPGSSVNWKATATAPVISVPTGGVWTQLPGASKGIWRYMGNEINYNVTISGVLSVASTDEEDDFRLSIPYPINQAAYLPESIIGDLWADVIYGANSNTFKAYARPDPTDSNQVRLRVLSGTKDDSLATLLAGSALTIKGEVKYSTNNQVQSINPYGTYDPLDLQQDVSGQVILNGYGNLPRARLDIVSGPDASTSNALVLDQRGTGNSLIVMNQGIPKTIFDSAGHIGIGTLAPLAELHVEGNIYAKGNITLSNNRSGPALLVNQESSCNILQLERSGIVKLNVLENGFVGIGTSVPQQQLHMTGSARIDGGASIGNGLIVMNGHIGIGTTTPLAELHVEGDIYTRGNMKVSNHTSSGAALLVNQEGSCNILQLERSGIVKLNVLENGFVGIGTTDPQQQLHMIGSARIDGGASIGNGLIIMNQGIPTTTIDSTGHIGIGTLAPLAELHVEGDIYAKGNITLSNESIGPALLVNQESSCNILQLERSGVVKFNVLENGFVGIGTTLPQRQLHMTGSAQIDGNASVGDSLIVMNGHIGIGTTTPLAELHVEGDIYAKGYIKVSNDSSGPALLVNQESSCNILQLERSGIIKFNVLENGFVGIGTTDPQQQLHVSESARIDGGASIGNGLIMMNQGIPITTIDSLGRIGIGTLAALAELHVEGDIYTRGNIKVSNHTSSGPALLVNQEGSCNILQLERSGIVKLNVLENGFVGIGTTDPQQQLHMIGSARIDGGASIGNGLIIMNQSIPVTTIDSAGHIGIGTLAPLAELHVEGDIYAKGYIKVSNDTSGPALLVNQESSSNILQLERSGIVKLIVLENGFVGIGTTDPKQQLHMIGSARIDGGASINNRIFLGQGIGTLLELQDEGSPRVIVLNGGNVGIGTTDPKQQFHITESAFIDGNVGIGVTEISSIYRLQVNGKIYASDEIYAMSDIRMKTDIKPLTNSLEKITKLTGFTYLLLDGHERHMGLSAQDVQAIAPEVVKEDEHGRLSVAYGNLVALLIEGMKELQAQMQKLAPKYSE